MPLYERTVSPVCTLVVENSVSESIQTELGTAICQICLFLSWAGEKSSAKLELGLTVIVAGSKPDGGPYRDAASAGSRFFLALLQISSCW